MVLWSTDGENSPDVAAYDPKRCFFRSNNNWIEKYFKKFDKVSWSLQLLTVGEGGPESIKRNFLYSQNDLRAERVVRILETPQVLTRVSENSQNKLFRGESWEKKVVGGRESKMWNISKYLVRMIEVEN